MDTTQGRMSRRAIRIAAADGGARRDHRHGGAVAAQTPSTTPETQAQAAPAVPGDQQGFGGPTVVVGSDGRPGRASARTSAASRLAEAALRGMGRGAVTVTPTTAPAWAWRRLTAGPGPSTPLVWC